MVIDNNASSLTVWGNVVSSITNGDAISFKDYHLMADSTLIDASVDPAEPGIIIDPTHVDIDGDAPVCDTPPVGFQCRDVGADEVVP